MSQTQHTLSLSGFFRIMTVSFLPDLHSGVPFLLWFRVEVTILLKFISDWLGKLKISFCQDGPLQIVSDWLGKLKISFCQDGPLQIVSDWLRKLKISFCLDLQLIDCFSLSDAKKPPGGGGGMMGMPMTPGGGGGGKFNTVAARPTSGAGERNIPNSWNRSHDDSKYYRRLLFVNWYFDYNQALEEMFLFLV